MSVVTVTAYRAVCDRCGEHDGQYYDAPYGLTEEDLDPGWIIRENDGAMRCTSCNEEDRQLGCAADTGHEFDSPGNRHLASFWSGGDGMPEFQLRHCANGCGRTEMRARGGNWYGFDRWGWQGDPDDVRITRGRERERLMKVKGDQNG